MSQPDAYVDEAPFHPDEVQVPEALPHREMSILAAAAAADALGRGWRVVGNLNWYPMDGGNAVAPDVMVLPADALDAAASSYRQGETGGPVPVAVVEIPSESDSFEGFMVKLRRYQRLGTTAYVVSLRTLDVTRLSPTDDEPKRWLGQPCPELGGIAFKVLDGRLGVWLPEGIEASTDDEVRAALRAQREAEKARAEAEKARAEAEKARAERLAAQLRALGVEPEA